MSRKVPKSGRNRSGAATPARKTRGAQVQGVRNSGGRGTVSILSRPDFLSVVRQDPTLSVVSLDDVVAAYGVGKRTLLRYAATGELQVTRFGRKYVVTVSELRRFLAANRTTKTS